MNKEYASVDQVIEILQKVSDQGKGHYTVGCNDEYYLAKPKDEPVVDDNSEEIDLGGYC